MSRRLAILADGGYTAFTPADPDVVSGGGTISVPVQQTVWRTRSSQPSKLAILGAIVVSICARC